MILEVGSSFVCTSVSQKSPFFFHHFSIIFSIIPECVARVPVSLWGSGGWGCVRSTLLNRSQPFATVHNRPQPSATVRNRPRDGHMAVPTVSSAEGVGFGGFKRRVASFRVAGVAWHSDVFCNVSKVVLCGRHNTFTTFSEDVLQFSWQGQHFGRVHRHFAWQAQHLRRVVLRFFLRIALSGLCQVATRCKFCGRRGILYFTIFSISQKILSSFPHISDVSKRSTVAAAKGRCPYWVPKSMSQSGKRCSWRRDMAGKIPWWRSLDRMGLYWVYIGFVWIYIGLCSVCMGLYWVYIGFVWIYIGLCSVCMGLYWVYIGFILGLYWCLFGLYGFIWGLYGFILGLYWVYVGLCSVCMGLYGVYMGLYWVCMGLYCFMFGLYGFIFGLYGFILGLYGFIFVFVRFVWVYLVFFFYGFIMVYMGLYVVFMGFYWFILGLWVYIGLWVYPSKPKFDYGWRPSFFLGFKHQTWKYNMIILEKNGCLMLIVD